MSLQCWMQKYLHPILASQKKKYTDYLDLFEKCGINAVFFQIRSKADAYYESQYEPWSKTITGTVGKNPGYDVLKFLIDETHARGMQFHAWINPYRVETRGSASAEFPALDPKIPASCAPIGQSSSQTVATQTPLSSFLGNSTLTGSVVPPPPVPPPPVEPPGLKGCSSFPQAKKATLRSVYKNILANLFISAPISRQEPPLSGTRRSRIQSRSGQRTGKACCPFRPRPSQCSS